ncbi:TerC/Alx family metal homeostasis membrane protein [Buchnera aphidicola]|uniref:TerC/Alx family metal homeostasis membrane protein n=1 Tax=Buchnera aphidicola TaxID=9 RepID=UPI003464E641
MYTIGTPFLWTIFSLLSIAMIAIEIGLQKKNILVKTPLKCSIFFSLLWLGVVILFTIILWSSINKNIGYDVANIKTLSFFSSYCLEQFLSIDNIIVWFLLFQYFSIPVIYQRKVLIYGLLGAVVFRIIIIFIGNWFLYKYNWILYIFGVIILYTGIKTIFYTHSTVTVLSNNQWISWFYRKFRITNKLEEDNFFLWENKIFFFTPLFLVTILIELSDIIFAIDSVSAILSITIDPFIIITSNLLAIFNLRSIYFLLSYFGKQINIIKYSVGFILIFIGIKILIEHFLYIPEFFYLIVIGVFLSISIVLNIFYVLKKKFFKINKKLS